MIIIFFYYFVIWSCVYFNYKKGKRAKQLKILDHQFLNLSPETFDTSHTINHLSFGKDFPGKQYPLDGKYFGNDKGEL